MGREGTLVRPQLQYQRGRDVELGEGEGHEDAQSAELLCCGEQLMSWVCLALGRRDCSLI